MWKREGERGQLSILRHDFSEDTAACCDYWGAAKKRDTGRKGVRERAWGRQQRKRQGRTNGWLVGVLVLNSRTRHDADDLGGNWTWTLFGTENEKLPKAAIECLVRLVIVFTHYLIRYSQTCFSTSPIQTVFSLIWIKMLPTLDLILMRQSSCTAAYVWTSTRWEVWPLLFNGKKCF